MRIEPRVSGQTPVKFGLVDEATADEFLHKFGEAADAEDLVDGLD